MRAVIISIAALAVPFSDTSFSAEHTDPISSLLWLLALVPAFLLAYYRGWRGVATALAAGMAALSTAVSIMAARGLEINQQWLLPVVASYVAIALATGWLSEALHARRERAELLALTDDLTGLPNRRRARTRLEQLLAAQDREAVCVVLFDLDNFKTYNDRYGHPAGDTVLCMFADVLRNAVGPQDMPVRYGGEEFLVLLSGYGEDDAVAFANRVRHALIAAQPNKEAITVSAGIASRVSAGESANSLIIAADRALYKAKTYGRDRVVLATGPIAASG